MITHTRPRGDRRQQRCAKLCHGILRSEASVLDSCLAPNMALGLYVQPLKGALVGDPVPRACTGKAVIPCRGARALLRGHYEGRRSAWDQHGDREPIKRVKTAFLESARRGGGEWGVDPPSHWARFCSGASANQKFPPAPSASQFRPKRFFGASKTSAPLGGGGLDPPTRPPLDPQPPGNTGGHPEAVRNTGNQPQAHRGYPPPFTVCACCATVREPVPNFAVTCGTQ